ncbi:BOLA1 protein [Nymphaea thermarum]|nr:BOLA1 protein [Nymphaea thermarum]
MSSRGASAMLSRASRIKQKLQSALEATALDIEDVSYKHAGHAAVRSDATETHFNVKIVSQKFEGQNLVKRHRMVYDLLAEELQSGLHALSIVAKTPQELEGARLFAVSSHYRMAKGYRIRMFSCGVPPVYNSKLSPPES